MDKKEDPQFPDTTEEEKERILAGSPVTIGGGLALVQEAFIKFDPAHWKCDCENGLLTLERKDGNVDAIYMKDPPPPSGRRISHAKVEEIRIWFKL
jgi:hypothetical protein